MSQRQIPALTAEEADRFWSHVSITDNRSDCWEWQQAVHVGFQPHWGFRGRQFRARRVAYTATFGPIPAHATLAQTCGNFKCVNPHHLVPCIPYGRKVGAS